MGGFRINVAKNLKDFWDNDALDYDENDNPLQEVGETRAAGVYGKPKKEPIYILPHFYLGSIHLTDVAVTVLDTDNIQCLIGRSILHQCVLTLDPELNNIHFNFKESLKNKKEMIDDIEPFNEVHQFVEMFGI